MNVILDYICDEIDEIEQKIQKEGKLSMAEVEYLDRLEHIKKDRLTSEAMMDGGYSNDGSYDGYNGNGGSMTGGNYMRGNSGRRGRDTMGRYTSGRRYSRDEGVSMLSQEIERLMDDAKTPEEREVLKQAHQKLKQMM